MAGSQALNDTELERLLREPLKEAVDYVVQKIWNENREIIEQIIYRSEAPEYYQRTGEFKNAWETLTTVKTGDGNTVEGNFFYAPNLMSATPADDAPNHMGQHYGVGDTSGSTNGNNNFRANGQMRSKAERSGGQYGDSREYLADIIYQGLAGDIYGKGAWTKKETLLML